jgi:hypothetical protein
MSYTPNNPPVYLAAFAGAVTGLGARDNPIGDVAYSANMANAFAQAVDTAFGDGAYTGLDLNTIRSASQAAWQTRSPLSDPQSLNANAYVTLADEIVALALQSDAEVESEGIDPNAGGGGGGGGGETTVIVTDTTGAYTVKAAYNAMVDTTTGAIATLTLGTGALGSTFEVDDLGCLCNANNITVDPAAGCQLEDPNNPGGYLAIGQGCTFVVAGQWCRWRFDGTSRYKIISSGT